MLDEFLSDTVPCAAAAADEDDDDDDVKGDDIVTCCIFPGSIIVCCCWINVEFEVVEDDNGIDCVILTLLWLLLFRFILAKLLLFNKLLLIFGGPGESGPDESSDSFPEDTGDRSSLKEI